MIESFIGNEASSIIGKVVKSISHEISLGWQITPTGLLEKLGEELKKLEPLLEGASEITTTNKTLISWLEKIESIAYEADDLIDEWAYADLERKVNNIKLCTEAESQHQGVGKVEELLEKIKGLYEEAKGLGIKPVKVAGGECYESPSSAAIRQREEQKLMDQRVFVEQELLFGRDADFDHIVEVLKEATYNSYQKLNVIGIVGMAGLGKTTLSHRIEKSQDMKGLLFDEVIFVVVSNEYGSIGDILNKVADKVIEKREDSSEVISMLQEKLGRKKYLLILDDVWHTLPWNRLSSVLVQIGGSKGTTILVTSRERKVVQNMSTHGEPHIHTLKGLDNDDSWSLLLKNKITGDNNLVDGEKKEIAKKLIRKCDGNPLAINVLGGLLRKNSDVEKWREFEKSNEWAKNDDDDEGNVLASLKLSFTHLKSPTLKSCFSYCAVFEEDEEINKDKLIRLWMAQGILPEREHVEMEVVGEECFNELLDSSLFQEPIVHYGVLVSVKMHDLVRDLARVVSKRNIAREASTSSGGGELHCKFSRSLLNCRYQTSLNVLRDYKKLRALILNIVVDQKEEWKSLGELKHLRFLDITIYMHHGTCSEHKIEMLDLIVQEIAKLYYLQTLSIRGEFLGKERHVLPKSFTNLVNLRHFEMEYIPPGEQSSIGIIEGLGNLTKLQVIPPIDLIKNWGGTIRELQNLSRLSGTLDISNIEEEDEARSLNVGARSSLKALHVRNTRNNNNEILEALKPVDSLNDVMIKEFWGTSLPTWLTSRVCSLSNLTRLSLVRCERATGELNMGNFSCLRYLKLISCQELSVVFPEEGFKCCKLLEVLVIRSCSKVNSLPNDVSPLTKLRTLFIQNNGITPNATSKLHGLDSLQCSKVRTPAFLIPTTKISQGSLICKSLEALDIIGDPGIVETIPDQLQHLVALRFLKLSGYKKQKELSGHVIANMTSLKGILLDDMPQLVSLPSESIWHRFSNLSGIHITGCPLLEKYDNKSVEDYRSWTSKVLYRPEKIDNDTFFIREYLYTCPYNITGKRYRERTRDYFNMYRK